jgi:UDP-N-acetylmuramyl tripeptide synthase
MPMTRFAGDHRKNSGRPCIPGMSDQADIRPVGRSGHGINGLSFSAQTSGVVPVESSLVGKHNLYNILSAIGAACPELQRDALRYEHKAMCRAGWKRWRKGSRSA